MSRLKREGNPPSNQQASPVPQAWDPSISDFREITGQNLGGGRFGTDGVQWGKTASGLFMPIRVTNDGTQEVQLSGTIDSLLYSLTSDRMIENPVQFFGENVATVGLVNSIDISGASQVVVVLENRHDVAVKVTRMCLTREAGQELGAMYANAVYREEKTTSIPAGASVYLDKEIYATLGKIGVGLVLRIERDTAPTSGNLRMLVYGRRN